MSTGYVAPGPYLFLLQRPETNVFQEHVKKCIPFYSFLSKFFNNKQWLFEFNPIVFAIIMDMAIQNVNNVLFCHAILLPHLCCCITCPLVLPLKLGAIKPFTRYLFRAVALDATVDNVIVIWLWNMCWHYSIKCEDIKLYSEDIYDKYKVLFFV